MSGEEGAAAVNKQKEKWIGNENESSDQNVRTENIKMRILIEVIDITDNEFRIKDEEQKQIYDLKRET